MTGLAAATLAVGVLAWPGAGARVPAPVAWLRRSGLAVLVALATAGTALLATGTGPTGLVVAPLLGGAAGAATRWLSGRARARTRSVPPLRLAASFDLLAACLRSGLDVPRAVTVIADELPERLAGALHRTAVSLALGAPAEQAWEPALALPAVEPLARGAVRSARSGAALADIAASLAVRTRAQAEDAVNAAAGRAGVLVSGPLGCCFLPAFFVLGVVPVIAGLVGTMLDNW